MATYYYVDELNTEFSGDDIKPRVIDSTYKYIRSKAAHTFWYNLIARPIARVYMKLKYHHEIVGLDKLKEVMNSPVFIYGNHTNPIADAFVPAILLRPRPIRVIVNANNVSMPILGSIVPHLGGMPLPDNKEALKNFMNAIDYYVNQKEPIVIYPEAHIWPYCTWIRNFTNKSFHYPVNAGAPVMCYTNTYQRYKNTDKIKMVTYIDGPFYAPTDLNKAAQKQYLRDEVYNSMCSRAKNNTLVINEFVYRP